MRRWTGPSCVGLDLVFFWLTHQLHLVQWLKNKHIQWELNMKVINYQFTTSCTMYMITIIYFQLFTGALSQWSNRSLTQCYSLGIWHNIHQVPCLVCPVLRSGTWCLWPQRMKKGWYYHNVCDWVMNGTSATKFLISQSRQVILGLDRIWISQV